MRKLILLILLFLSIVLCTQTNAFVTIWGSGTNGGTSCVTTGPDVAISLMQDTYENEGWALTGNDNWSEVAAARGACSTTHWSLSAITAGDYLTYNFADVDAYADIWIKFTGGPDDNNEYVNVLGFETDDSLYCVEIQLRNDSGTQNFVAYYYDNGAVTSATLESPSASTWYHIGIHYDAAANVMQVYISDIDALGAADLSVSSMTTSRTPGLFRIGTLAKSGTFSGTLQYDSLGIDDDAITAVEYAP